MRRGPFSIEDQALELSQLVTIERIRKLRPSLAPDLIEKGLNSGEAKRIAQALSGTLAESKLTEEEQNWLEQVKVLAGS